MSAHTGFWSRNSARLAGSALPLEPRICRLEAAAVARVVGLLSSSSSSSSSSSFSSGPPAVDAVCAGSESGPTLAAAASSFGCDGGSRSSRTGVPF